MKALFPHAQTTDGITVRVAVSFLSEQSDPGRGRWFWSYHIRIENGSGARVQLMTRHWTITDARGNRKRVEGEGVVGDRPLLAPGEAYDYVSGCPLGTPTGAMEGEYGLVGEDGHPFRVTIPRFSLIGPAVAR